MASAILTIASGCDKAKTPPPAPATREAAARPAAELAARPDVLFEVFGDRSAPRMLPIATIDGGKLAPLSLSDAAWRAFDKTYTRSGASYPIFQDGVAVGSAVVTRGMWEQPDSAVYSLPNCRTLTPLSEVRLDGDVRPGSTVELLAATRPLGSARPARTTTSETIANRLRALGYLIGGKRGIDHADLDSLSFRALAVPTGATGAPTLVGTYVNSDAHDDDDGAFDRKHPRQATQLFFLADSVAYSYNVSYSSGGTTRADSLVAERFVDHLDLDGDGVDEIVLDAWTFDETSFPIVLKFRDGEWREIFRGRASWCADPKKK